MASVSSPIIVGRDEELARIERALNEAATGRPRILFVTGEAGIGKSRLVREAIDRARAQGCAILHGACLDIGQGWLPYLPVVEALRGLARDLPADRLDYVLGVARTDLARILPTLAPEGTQDSSPPDGEHEPSLGERARLFERFIGLLGRMSENAPTLAVLEDVQWIDPATRDLVTFLVRNLTTESVLAVLTIRTDELPAGHPVLAWLAELGRAPGAVRLDLTRLDRPAVARQMEAIAGTTLDDATADRIWRRSEGNPLFAEELLGSELHRMEPVRPPLLVDILLARIARLPADGQAVVEALAVAGRPADERLLAPVLEREERSVGIQLREAVGHGVALITPDGRYRFRHELLRELIERELSAAQRRDLHERFARELEARPELAEPGPAGPAGELARHWAEADRPVEAHRAALAAAAAAESVNAVEQAFRLLDAAIGLERRLPAASRPETPDRIEIRRRAADAADLAGAFDRAIELTAEALDLSDAGGDPTITGLLHARLGYLRWVTGDVGASLEEHREAVRLVPESPASRGRARVLGGLAGALMGLGRWEESRAVAAEATACASEAGAVVEESRARNFLGSDLVALGDTDAGLAELRRSHTLAAAGPPDLPIVTGYNLALNLVLAADRLEEALEIASAMRERARSVGLERRFGMDLAGLAADILVRLGRWDEADAISREGIALDQRRRGTAYLAAVRARLAALRGAAGEAERRLSELRDAREEADTAAFVAMVAAEAALVRDRPGDALVLAADGLAALGEQHALDNVGEGDRSEPGSAIWAAPLACLRLRALADLAETARAEHDAAGLAAVGSQAESVRGELAQLGSRALSPSGRAWTATAEAELTRLEGHPDRGAWARAVLLWDAIPDRHQAAYGRYREAEAALRAEGVRADVASVLREAAQTTEQLRAEPLRRRIEELASRARVDLHPAEAPVAAAPEIAAAAHPASHRLSAREVEVLRLVAAGRTNGEIAEELFITRKTAGVHVTHILDKLGVSNRVEAAMAASRLGLVPQAQDE